MKKALFIFIGLVGGIAIGYLMPHSGVVEFDKITKGSEAFKALTRNDAVKREILAQFSHSFRFTEGTIKADDARALIAGFKAQNLEDIRQGGGLYSADAANSVHEVGGFVISRTAIEAIFNNNGTQKCNGIRVYFAKHPGFTSERARIFTFIFAGTKAAANKSADDTSDDIEDPVYDHVDPCPNNCGTLRQ
jgi:hypothetical protein